MKLIDAIQIKQGKFEIPESSRDHLPAFFKEMGYGVGAEIGVWKGRYSAQFCNIGLKMFAIDPWSAYLDFWERPGWAKDSQKMQDDFYRIAQWRLNRFKRCTILKKTSMEAAMDFEDNSLDFVYIDGHHGFKYIAEDLYVWTKKVKIGGIISGHDYLNRTDWTCHVKFVVDAFVQAFEIENWWILGDLDRYKSWMFIKEKKIR